MKLYVGARVRLKSKHKKTGRVIFIDDPRDIWPVQVKWDDGGSGYVDPEVLQVSVPVYKRVSRRTYV